MFCLSGNHTHVCLLQKPVTGWRHSLLRGVSFLLISHWSLISNLNHTKSGLLLKTVFPDMSKLSSSLSLSLLCGHQQQLWPLVWVWYVRNVLWDFQLIHFWWFKVKVTVTSRPYHYHDHSYQCSQQGYQEIDNHKSCICQSNNTKTRDVAIYSLW